MGVRPVPFRDAGGRKPGKKGPPQTQTETPDCRRLRERLGLVGANQAISTISTPAMRAKSRMYSMSRAGVLTL